MLEDALRVLEDAGCVVEEVGSRFIITISKEQADSINTKFIVENEQLLLKEGDTLFDFSAARNYAASLASNNMISNQDADEEYSKLNIDKIHNLIDQNYDQFEYEFVFSHDQFNNPSVQFVQCKFYNRDKLEWKGYVHEVLQPRFIPDEGIKRLYLDESIIKLEHWQNQNTQRGNYLKGLALDCFLHPDNDRNSHYLARELLWNKRPKSAVKQFMHHISMKKWVAEASQSMIYLGDAYGQLNEGDKQIEWYHKAFLHDPTRREALIKLAYFYKFHNEPQKVICYTKAALEIPWHGFYANQVEHYKHIPHELLYWSYGWLGRIEEAKEHILKALEYQPYNSTYLDHTKYYFSYPSNNIDGWMRFPELQWLYNTSKTMNTIAEIGSWKGRSTHALCSGCKGVVTAIDHFLGSKGEEQEHIEAKEEGDVIYHQFIYNTKDFRNLTVNRKDSEEAVKEYPDRHFDMVFIDAEHTYEGVKKDIKAWKNKARILLCGHDFNDTWPDVRRAVIEELGYVDIHDSIWYKYIIDFPKVSIVIPTLGREDKLQTLLHNIKENAEYTNYEVIVESDSFENRQGTPKTLKKGIEKSTGELVMFLGNDCIPEKNFLFLAVIAMIREFSNLDGLIGLNDGYWFGGDLSTHWLASKKLLPYLEGEFFYTGYHHLGCDNELTERCRRIGKYFWAEEAKVYHDHPIQSKFTSETDEVYNLAYDEKSKIEDTKLLEERSKKYNFIIRSPLKAPRKYPENIHPSIDLRKRLKNYRDLNVLNVGVGSGTSILEQQLPFFRFNQLFNIDIYQPYLDFANKNVIWDSKFVFFENKDIRNITDFDYFDLVLMFDVIEHLPKIEALKVLANLKKSSCKLLMFVPEETGQYKNETGVDSMTHLSYWKSEEFISIGFKVEIISDFNYGDFLATALWITKK